MRADAEARRDAECEYIVVGSGAGGGLVAANLAEAGHTVLLLEAGGDALQLADPRLPDDYHVPCFHAFASENEAMKWDFFVRHYASDAQQRCDPNFTRERDGVLYPRAGTLGGCTAHNAMIMVYPHNADWDYLFKLTGDASWQAERMRQYFQRLEDCHYRSFYRWLHKHFGLNCTRHGFGGWLSTQRADPMIALREYVLMWFLRSAAKAALAKRENLLKRLLWFFQSRGDPNDWRLVRTNAFGMRNLPVSTSNRARIGSRERLLDVACKHPDKLRIQLDALVTRVLLDSEKRAVGVEYLHGECLYRAHARPNDAAGELRQACASREIILCGGVFNTPQLLMLSGIGPSQELKRHGIEVRVPLAGVGTNLQDRYEVSVVTRMKQDWKLLAGAQFAKGDSQYQQWATKAKRKGVYTTNGGVLAVITKSAFADTLPDLFCLALLGKFRGYRPGYSQDIAKHHNYLSWVVLKAHTHNTAGTVTLQSPNPRDMPRINFHYFDEGNDTGQKDLEAMVEGVEFVRAITKRLGRYIEAEELPGEGVQSREELRRFVKKHAWGHHASGTCPIGPPEKNGVLNGNFQVHGTKNLRVVDASVFPKIPGFFIVSSVYMIAEKASEVILKDAQ